MDRGLILHRTLLYPILYTDDPLVSRAYRAALGDLMGNIQPLEGLVEYQPFLCFALYSKELDWCALLEFWHDQSSAIYALA